MSNDDSIYLSMVTKSSFRFEITLSEMAFYNVDNVFHLIAASQEPFGCGKICRQCPISDAHETKRIDMHRYECDGLFKRHFVLSTLLLQLKKMVDLGRFQVWDSQMRRKREIPWTTMPRNLEYRDFRNWVREAYIFPDDLLVFLASEKIRARFVTYSASPTGEVVINPVYDQQNHLAWEAPLLNSVGETADKLVQPISSQCARISLEPTLARPHRFDYLATEIDEILTNDSTMTPAQVWKELIGRVGSLKTCIVSTTDVGLRWKNAKGALMLADHNNIASRVTRWKKARR